jgi:hypothetical protein
MNEFIEPKGINFSCSKEIDSNELSNNLGFIVDFLEKINPNDQLHQFDDWWEHDGLHFYRGKTNFDELKKIVSISGLMQEFKLGNFDVFIGIAPIENNWYLRFYLDEEENLGRFDITFSDEMAEVFTNEVLEKLTVKMNQQPSETYYKSIIC